MAVFVPRGTRMSSGMTMTGGLRSAQLWLIRSESSMPLRTAGGRWALRCSVR